MLSWGEIAWVFGFVGVFALIAYACLWKDYTVPAERQNSMYRPSTHTDEDQALTEVLRNPTMASWHGSERKWILAERAALRRIMKGDHDRSVR